MTASNQPPAQLEQLWTTRDVADYLKLKEGSVRAMAREGRIPVRRMGRLYRYRRTEIELWLERQINHEKTG